MDQPLPHDSPGFREVRVPSTYRDAKLPERDILKEVERHGYDDDATFAIKLALEEAMTNAVKHGNRNDPSKCVIVRYAVDDRRVVICIRDQGSGFMPSAVPDPTQPDRLMLPSGRGIMLMKAYMDEVEYRHDGTEVYLVKLRK